MREVLRMNSQLETLILRSWLPPLPPDSVTGTLEPEDEEEPIHLPFLTTLHLEMIHHALCDNLVRTLVAPKCRNMYVYDLTEDALDAGCRFGGLSMFALQTASTLYVTVALNSQFGGPAFTQAEITISTSGGNMSRIAYSLSFSIDEELSEVGDSIHLRLFSRRPIPTLRKLASFLSAAESGASIFFGTCRGVHPNTPLWDWEFPVDVLEALPNLQTLWMGGVDTDIILEHLSEKTIGADGITRLPCPGLEWLCLGPFHYTSEEDDPLGTFIRRRRRLCPKAFKRVVFRQRAVATKESSEEEDDDDEDEDEDEDEAEEEEDEEVEDEEGEKDSEEKSDDGDDGSEGGSPEPESGSGESAESEPYNSDEEEGEEGEDEDES